MVLICKLFHLNYHLNFLLFRFFRPDSLFHHRIRINFYFHYLHLHFQIHFHFHNLHLHFLIFYFLLSHFLLFYFLLSHFLLFYFLLFHSLFLNFLILMFYQLKLYLINHRIILIIFMSRSTFFIPYYFYIFYFV